MQMVHKLERQFMFLTVITSFCNMKSPDVGL